MTSLIPKYYSLQNPHDLFLRIYFPQHSQQCKLYIRKTIQQLVLHFMPFLCQRSTGGLYTEKSRFNPFLLCSGQFQGGNLCYLCLQILKSLNRFDMLLSSLSRFWAMRRDNVALKMCSIYNHRVVIF